MHRPTAQEINLLPLYQGVAMSAICLVENEQDAQYALQTLSQFPCLGVDTESKPTFRKGEKSAGPTLIQLSTACHVFLFPVRFSVALNAANTLLSDPQIKKVGFGIKGDIKALRHQLGIELINTEDLSVTLKRVAADKNPIGARAAVAMVLKQRLPKGEQQSNWVAYPLKKQQIVYAANDAHAAICVAQAIAYYTV